MILALDVGNSNIFGGVMHNGDMLIQFRKSTITGFTSDEFGVFLRGVLRENNVDANTIRKIAICSVVPDLQHTLASTCLKYFDTAPFFLHPGVETGLIFAYTNPRELGADRVANAVAAAHMYPDSNIVIVDFGTATTVCAINKDRKYLGGLIMPGIRISMQALASTTAKLPIVEIKSPERLVGQSTVECIQSGLYYSNLAMVREIVAAIRKKHFNSEEMTLLGTGGFVRLFESAKIFDAIIPDLVLLGLCKAVDLN